MNPRMSDEDAKAFAEKARQVVAGVPGAGTTVNSADMVRFLLRLHDDVEALKAQQRFPTFGDAA